MLSTCKHCKAKIQWVPTIDGKKLPVYPVARDDGGLVKNEQGLLTRYNGESCVARFRSHLLDCKLLARELHSKAAITIPTFVCDWRNCDVDTVHIHCFACGEIGHVASDCETESEPKDLVAGMEEN